MTTTLKKLKNELSKQLSNSTFHGLGQIQNSESVIGKIFWIVFFSTFVCLTADQIIGLVLRYRIKNHINIYQIFNEQLFYHKIEFS